MGGELEAVGGFAFLRQQPGVQIAQQVVQMANYH
jgi:hypothetical protein